MAERSKAKVCGRYSVGVAGSNSARAWMFIACECQVEVSATGQSRVQRSPIDCGVLLCVIYKRQE